jgi:hypothetical protein
MGRTKAQLAAFLIRVTEQFIWYYIMLVQTFKGNIVVLYEQALICPIFFGREHLLLFCDEDICAHSRLSVFFLVAANCLASECACLCHWLLISECACLCHCITLINRMSLASPFSKVVS